MSETEHPHEGEELFDDPEAVDVDVDVDDDDIQEDFDEEEAELPDDVDRFRGG
jgi:hypothetical protein